MSPYLTQHREITHAIFVKHQQNICYSECYIPLVSDGSVVLEGRGKNRAGVHRAGGGLGLPVSAQCHLSAVQPGPGHHGLHPPCTSPFQNDGPGPS